MSRLKLFHLPDIAPQLEPEQVKDLEEILYMAKETRTAQFAELTTTAGKDKYGQDKVVAIGRTIVCWPSGLMQFWTGKKPVEGEYVFIQYGE